ncbi:MAG: tocopherol cyclase family protein [Cyanobacteria bacterium J06650_10]
MAHEGYHWRRQTSRFFEGWYFRLTLPEIAQTFAFMYSIDDPAGGGDHSGGAVQILGPDEAYLCRTFPNVEWFWAWPHRLGFGHWRDVDLSCQSSSGAQYLEPEHFGERVTEGYQIGANRHVGKLRSPLGKTAAEWDYTIEPVMSWGSASSEAKATAGWLSYLPVFEPGWQVLMAHGLASGHVCWQGKHYAFEKVPAYAEKNWGGAFPSKWFWVQCNAFADVPNLSVTAAGGVRDVLTWQENVGLIGIHYQDQFYEFFSTKTQFAWQVNPWGYWHLTAADHQYRVKLTGRVADEGTLVRVPTREGLQWLCRDTTHGNLKLRLSALKDQRVIVEATSNLAGLEVGGAPWDEPWIIRS